jgi:hypothetical protein
VAGKTLGGGLITALRMRSCSGGDVLLRAYGGVSDEKICDDLKMERMHTEIKALTAGLQKQNETASAVLLGINESIMAFATSNAQLSENPQEHPLGN